MKNRKIVLLDLGGVVFQSSGNSNKKIQWEIINKLNRKYGFDMDIGKDLFKYFLEEYNQITDQELSGKVFLKLIFDTLEINSELIDIISKKHKIIILSDNYRENIAYISKQYKFSDWSANQIYSYEYGMVKSNPLFFKKLLDELDCKPTNLILIDDLKVNIENASKEGIHCILYQNNSQVRNDLKKYE